MDIDEHLPMDNGLIVLITKISERSFLELVAGHGWCVPIHCYTDFLMK
jgi:hypothetical protein